MAYLQNTIKVLLSAQFDDLVNSLSTIWINSSLLGGWC